MEHKRKSYEGLQLASPSQAGLETDGRGLEPAKNLQAEAEWAPADKQYLQNTQPKSLLHRKTFFGLRRTTLWLALLIILLIGAVAGIAGGLATRTSKTTTAAAPTQSSSIPSTSSTTSQKTNPSSTTSPISSATASASPYVCINNGSAYMTSDNSVFTVYCNTNFLVGTNYGTFAEVLTTLNINSFGACLEACAISNSLGVPYSNAGTCQSATWFSSGGQLDQCFLKNATANTDGSNGEYQPNDPSSQTGSLVG